ncbi:MAG: tetratricopeptide repeat protein, partial [Gordonia sp. (in: high G+C Gram-positive bacteria)]
ALADASFDSLGMLSRATEHLGRVRMARGDVDAARALFARSLAVRRDLVARTSGVGDPQQNLAVALHNWGRLHEQTGDLETAEAAYIELVALTREMSDGQPGVADRTRELSIALEDRARVRQRRSEVSGRHGLLDDARALLVESLVLHRGRVDAQGDAQLVLRDLQVCLGALGGVLLAQSDAASIGAFDEARDIASTLASRQPGSSQALVDEWIAVGNAGCARRDLGFPEDARACFAEQVDCARRLRPARPDLLRQALENYAASTRNLAGTAMTADPDAAVGLLNELRNIYRQMLEIGHRPETVIDLVRVTISLVKLVGQHGPRWEAVLDVHAWIRGRRACGHLQTVDPVGGDFEFQDRGGGAVCPAGRAGRTRDLRGCVGYQRAGAAGGKQH